MRIKSTCWCRRPKGHREPIDVRAQGWCPGSRVSRLFIPPQCSLGFQHRVPPSKSPHGFRVAAKGYDSPKCPYSKPGAEENQERRKRALLPAKPAPSSRQAPPGHFHSCHPPPLMTGGWGNALISGMDLCCVLEKRDDSGWTVDNFCTTRS